jgi:hypothetical protein
MKPTPKQQAEAIVAAAKQRAEEHGFHGELAAHFVIGALTVALETALTPKRRAKP